MERVEKIARISGFLTAMEEINMDERFQLYFHFQEIQFVNNVEKSISDYYQNYVEKINVLGENIHLLEESLSHWFFNPVQPSEPDIPIHHDSRISRFLSLIEDLLEGESFSLYELELPLGIFGSFSEHYALSQGDYLYLIHFTAA